MNPHRTTIALSVLLAAVLGLAVAARPDATRPNWEFLPEMKRSPALHAFEPTDLFPNGRAQQPSVPGTIPRGLMPLHFAPTREDALRAGEELENPYRNPPAVARSDARPDARNEAPPDAPQVAKEAPHEGDLPRAEPDPEQRPSAPDPQAELAASVRRGEALDRAFCAAFHGPGGAGDGPVARRGFPPPPPLPTGKSLEMKDGQLFHILTWGQGSMSPMAAQLDRGQRWDAVNDVRSLQSRARATRPPSAANADARGVPAAPDVPAAIDPSQLPAQP